MKRFSEQFHKEASRITLRASERRELRERIVAYMEYHPLPSHVPTASVRTEPFTLWRINLAQWRSGAAVSFMVALIIVPFAAERAVPGDVLYPVKVQFNEEVRSSLAFSSYEQVEWETKRLERRLAEARLLASEGKLTDEVEAEVAAAVKTHTEAVQRGVEEIRQTDQEAGALAQVAFATTLDAQAETFRAAIETSGVSDDSNVILAEALSTAQVVANQESATPSFDRLLAKVEAETTAAYEMLASLDDRRVNELTRRDIERRLGDIERSLRRAVALVDVSPSDEAGAQMSYEGAVSEEIATSATMAASQTGTTSEDEAATTTASEAAIPEALAAPLADPEAARQEAVTLLRAALKSAQKLILYMGDLELSSRVSVDTLVPVVPTPEEEADELTRRVQALKERTETLTTQVADDTTDEKVVYALVELARLNEQATVAIAAGEFGVARTAVTDAESIASDLARILEDSVVPATPAAPSPATSSATSTVESAATSSEATTSESALDSDFAS